MQTAPLKILAVDDEQLMLCALERACKGRSMNIRTAATAEQAVAEIDCCRFDLFLIDFDLKDPDCRQLLQTIDQRCPHVPVILMTTSDRKSDDLQQAVHACRKQGAWHLLEKPFSLERMIHFIGMICPEKGVTGVTEEIFQNDPKHDDQHEVRRHIRRPHVQPVNFAYSRIVDGETRQYSSRGILTDISDHGTGMLTHDPLLPGQVIRFVGNLAEKLGTVVWSGGLEDMEKTYRCGVRFY